MLCLSVKIFLVWKNDQFLAKNLQDLICDFSTINRYHDDLCPTGVEAAAADTLRLGEYAVTVKLQAISIKICLGLQDTAR